MADDEATSERAHKAFGPSKWIDLYNISDTLLQEAVVTLAPFGGLTANALSHLREDWIKWKEDFVIIRVPAEAECNNWKMAGGNGGSGNLSMPTINKRDEPCRYCRYSGTTNKFENLWSGRGGSGGRPHTTTLHRDIAEPGVEVLNRVFKTWGRSGIYTSPESVTQAARQLIDRYSDSDDPRRCYQKFLRTGVSLYCHYGLSREQIVDLTPFAKTTVERIEMATPEVSRNENNSYMYLRALGNNEPASVGELAQELPQDVQNQAVRKALKRLKDRGRVDVNKDGGKYQHTWSVVGNWSDPFECDVCGYKSPTLLGLSQHKQSHK